MATATVSVGWNFPTAVWPERAVKSLDLDSTLVERCLGGDDAAWEELVRLHTRRIYGLCYRFTGRDSEAQDLTQDVFLRVFRALGSFRSTEGSFRDMADPSDAQPADRPLSPHKERTGKIRLHRGAIAPRRRRFCNHEPAGRQNPRGARSQRNCYSGRSGNFPPSFVKQSSCATCRKWSTGKSPRCWRFPKEFP